MSYFYANTARTAYARLSAFCSGYLTGVCKFVPFIISAGVCNTYLQPPACVMKQPEKITSTKERILERVLPLFLVNNYETITIALMESATRITRGTIYRYFENKEDIFCQAVMQYYDSPLNVLFSIEADNHTLQSYWVIKMKQLESAYGYLRNYGILINVLAISHYIEVQAARIMPSFKDMILSHKLLNARYWTKVVKNTPDLINCNSKTTYKSIGQIYHGIYLHRCSTYPQSKLTLPNITFD